jgi:hypothetical protein
VRRVASSGGDSIPAVSKSKKGWGVEEAVSSWWGNEEGGRQFSSSIGARRRAAGSGGGSGETEEGDDPGWASLGRIDRAERAGCENFQGNDLGYQGESGRIDNGLWQILLTIFKQRFGF